MVNLKNKNVLMMGVSILGIILMLVLNSLKGNVTDLSLMQAQNLNGKYEAPTTITYLEKLGLLFLSSGVCYNFGVSEDVVEIGFQTLFNANLDEMTQTNKEDTLFSTDFEEIQNSLDVIDKTDGVLSEEDMASLENGKETTNFEEEIEEVIDYSKIFEISHYDFLDEKGKPTENDKIMRFTTPVGFSKENVDTTSNVWQINYRFYKNGLTGIDDSYWGSQLFDEDKSYFNRAWTSLKWLCQDYLNCVIVVDEENFFEAIVYSSDSTYYWYLMLDKLEDFDAYGFGTKNNVISMKVIPIKIEDAANIMYDLGVATEIEN